MHKAANPTHIVKCLPRMSWSPANLYNLYQRSYGPPTAETKFRKSSLTMFQQKWISKRLVRGYHGDWIREGIFKSQYLPDNLEPIVGPKSADPVPLASLMFVEIEKRIDTVIFRCCFADSAYKARQMIIHGKVLLNGKKHTDPNTRLGAGDLISVDPTAVSTLQPLSKSDSTPPPPTPDSIPATDLLNLSTDDLTPPPAALPPTPSTPPLAFNLPPFAAPFLFIPPYLEVSFSTCSAIYLRHPTAGPGMSEVPSPYEADGEVMRLAWEYYASLGRRGDVRPDAIKGKRLGA